MGLYVSMRGWREGQASSRVCVVRLYGRSGALFRAARVARARYYGLSRGSGR